MIINIHGRQTQWNLEEIRFLYPPDDFTGAFDNEKMQQRHKALQQEKIDVLLQRLGSENDPLKAMAILHPKEHIRFLENNLKLFKEKKRLEEAVLELYYRKNTPFSTAGEYEVWKALINSCDANRLYGLGKPFPGGVVTGFRGTLTGKAQGLSWSLSKKDTRWILSRWSDKNLGGGTVFSLEITRDDILYYIEDQKRQEVLLRPDVAENANPTEITAL